MTEQGNPLRDLVVRRLLELGHDGRPLAYKPAAMRSGGRVSPELIRQIALGRHSGRMTDEKIEGLALALGVRPAVVYEAAKLPRPGSRWRWPARFDRVRDEDRRLVEAFAAALLNAEERGRRGE